MDEFRDLLTDLQHDIEQLAEELAGDQPVLAAAVRRSAAWIPQPDQLDEPARRRAAGDGG